jgi:hypothetical protein
VRRCGGWVFRSLAHGVIPEVYDTQCGFKFFRGDIGRHLLQQSRVDGFAFTSRSSGSHAGPASRSWSSRSSGVPLAAPRSTCCATGSGRWATSSTSAPGGLRHDVAPWPPGKGRRMAASSS